MPIYSPDIQIFYGPKDEDHRIVPAPDIQIQVENNYSNDTIIGYTYILTLSGVITALDLRNIEYGGEYNEPEEYQIGAVIDHIHKMRQILAQNGNILHIIDGQSGDTILKARGGILKSLDIKESNNNWIHFAEYTATIEFNTIDLGNSTDNCGGLFLDPSTHTINSAGIVDVTKFKIKSFQDSWSLTFDEVEAFNRVKNNDNGYNLNINNTTFNIQYSISATGRHHYVYDDEESGTSQLLPAWEQAKNFVQYRLYEQVTNLINGVLKNTYTSGCSSTDGLSTLNIPGSSASGLYSSLNDSNFKIFNEQITCETSESDGTFSATYSAIVKSTRGNTSWSTHNTKHSVNKKITNTRNGDRFNKSINISGTIEGLIEGGLIRTNVPLSLPSSGSMFIYSSPTTNKYASAISLLDLIYSESDYNSGVGETGKRDLKPEYKTALGVTNAVLGTSYTNDARIDPPHPTTFNLTHDYNSGIINYNVEYSNNSPCNRKYQEISIETSNPNKLIAIFNIPNSSTCGIIQELGTFTAKTVNITIQGLDLTENGQPTEINLLQEIACGSCSSSLYLPATISMPDNSILTQQQYTKNPVDGSYTINISYICGTSGCAIA